VSVRVIASTEPGPRNGDARIAVSGELYYRLNVVATRGAAASGAAGGHPAWPEFSSPAMAISVTALA